MRQQLLRQLAAGLFAIAAAAWAPLDAHCAEAQGQGTIRIIAPSGPGLLDMLARAVGDTLARQLHTTVIVENKAGAGGNIGADAVAKAPPDGLTLLLADSGILTLNDRLYPSLPYNARTDFEPVSLIADVPMVLVVPTGSAIKSVSDLLFAAKAKPGGLFYASAGKGTGGQVAMQMLEYAGKVRMQHVPYKGSGDAATAVATSQVDVLFNNVPTLNPYLQSRKVRAIGVASAAPMESLPGVPTLDSSGLAGFKASAWFGLVAPKNTPSATLKKLEEAVAKGLKEPALVQQYSRMGVNLVASSRDDFIKTLAVERQRVAELVDSGAFGAD